MNKEESIFQGLKDVLDRYELVIKNPRDPGITKGDCDFVEFFDLHLAKSLLKAIPDQTIKAAKVILARESI